MCASCLSVIFVKKTFKTIKNHSLTATTYFALSLGFNMAECATSWQSAAHFEQPKNVHFEPFVRGLLIFLIGTKSVSEGGEGGGPNA